jgi:uracil-DNA glycosylase
MCLSEWKLKFFDTGEWQVLEERLRDRLEQGIVDNPDRGNLFAALDAISPESVKVVILGQDPYPTHLLATGIAFSIPVGETKMPPTLLNIFKEYSNDLGLPFPSSGSLLPWCKQGVLLWNVIPTCQEGLPASHRDWWEWYFLTQEILEKVDAQGAVVVSLGSFARTFSDGIEPSRVLSLSHPSPLAALKGNRPFLGSRMFSTINVMLVKQGMKPIDWRLE